MQATEGVDLAKMAVTVLLVVLIIGAVVAVVYAAYSWFGSGKDKLTDQVTSIDKSSFSQFDDTVVSGTDVISALRTYREAEIAIIIANKTCQGASGYVANPVADTTKVDAPNYCALVKAASPAASPAPGASPAPDDGLVTVSYKKEGWTIPGLAWDADTNQVSRNTNFSPTTTNSNAKAYVKQSADWYANLIIDESTGDIAGILFRQMN